MTTMEGEAKATIAEILAALSHALDLTEGQPRGHAVRTGLLAQTLGKTLGLSDEDLDSLYYAALLKDAGSSAGSTRLHRLYGDELETRRRVLYSEWIESGFGSRLRRILGMSPPPKEMVDELVAARCVRGNEIVRQLGFGPGTSEAILSMDEHWDGSGGPRQLYGEAIPITARILYLAQTLELFVTAFGRDKAYAIVESRSGRWFDPEVVRAALSFKNDDSLWNHHANLDGIDAPGLRSPAGAEAASEAGLDEICEAFARIVDSKSNFTGQHSTRVMRITVAAGENLKVRDLVTLRRAALLHDVGKLGVASTILDKAGPLDESEWEMVRDHPQHSFEILNRIRGFRRIAEIAGAHHERLDGSGYRRGLTAEFLDIEMRILACADVFDALTAERPYRGPMPLPDVYRIMRSDAGLDQQCVEAVWAAAARDRSLCMAPI